MGELFRRIRINPFNWLCDYWHVQFDAVLVVYAALNARPFEMLHFALLHPFSFLLILLFPSFLLLYMIVTRLYMISIIISDLTAFLQS